MTMFKTVLVISSLLLAACGNTQVEPETVHLSVKGMTCESCVNGITDAVRKLPGVRSCVVSLEESSAVVQFNPRLLSADQIQTRVQQLGYEAASER